MSNTDRNDYIVAMAEAKREYERYLLASKRSRPNTRVDSKKAAADSAADAPGVDQVAALEAIVPDSMLQQIVNEAIAPDELETTPEIEPATPPRTAALPASESVASPARRSRKKSG